MPAREYRDHAERVADQRQTLAPPDGDRRDPTLGNRSKAAASWPARNWIANWIADLGEKVVGQSSLWGSRDLLVLHVRLVVHAAPTPEPCSRTSTRSGSESACGGVDRGVHRHGARRAELRPVQDAWHGDSLGAVINMSLVRELGPVLAATMLAGRVGSAMAAELWTCVTEQIDALASMSANPIHYLVVPRFLACLVLIPALTTMADFMGVVGGRFTALGCSTSTRTITGRTRGISSESSTSSTGCSRASFFAPRLPSSAAIEASPATRARRRR